MNQLIHTATTHPAVLVPGGLLILALASLVGERLWRRLAPTLAKCHSQKLTPRMFGRVTVATEHIADYMRVPAVDCDEHYGDFQCGQIAGTLFQMAVAAGALTVPDGVRIVCNADNDIDTGGFVLIAFPAEPMSPWGVTSGYHTAKAIGARDPARTNDIAYVLEALGFFANELNIAIDGLEATVRRRRGLLGTLGVRRVPLDTTVPTADGLDLATSDAHECVQLILAQAAVAPENEIPGLVSALECILSFDERDAEQFVAKARTRARN